MWKASIALSDSSSTTVEYTMTQQQVIWSLLSRYLQDLIWLVLHLCAYCWGGWNLMLCLFVTKYSCLLCNSMRSYMCIGTLYFLNVHWLLFICDHSTQGEISLTFLFCSSPHASRLSGCWLHCKNHITDMVKFYSGANSNSMEWSLYIVPQGLSNG